MKKKAKLTKLKRHTTKPISKKKLELERGPSAAEIRRAVKATEKLKDTWEKDVEEIREKLFYEELHDNISDL